MGKGKLISFSGVDGSGKTTLSKLLENKLDERNISCKYIWCGWRGFESIVFKPFIYLVKKARNSGKAKNNTNTNSPSHSRLLFYLAQIDYFFRVFADLYVSLYTHDVVITDRYVYDVIAGFGGYRFLNIYPKPDVIFYINVSPELAYSRKDDILSLENVKELKNEYQSLFKSHDKDIIILDGSTNKDELIIIINNHLRLLNNE